MKKIFGVICCLLGVFISLLALLIPVLMLSRNHGAIGIIGGAGFPTYLMLIRQDSFRQLLMLGASIFVGGLLLLILRKPSDRSVALKRQGIASLICGILLLIASLVSVWEEASFLLSIVSVRYDGQRWNYFCNCLAREFWIPLVALSVIVMTVVLLCMRSNDSKRERKVLTACGAAFLVFAAVLLLGILASALMSETFALPYYEMFIANRLWKSMLGDWWIVIAAGYLVYLSVCLLSARNIAPVAEEKMAPIQFDGIWTMCTVTAVKKDWICVRYDVSGKTEWIPLEKIVKAATGDRFRVDEDKFIKM